MPLTAAPEPLRALGHRDLGQHPVPGPPLLDPGVEHDRLPVALTNGDGPVEELTEYQYLGRPLLEPAHVHQPGGDHLSGVDRRHPGHRDEDPPAPEHLDDQPQYPGRLVALTQHHDDVAHLADLVPVRVEYGQAGEAGDVHARRGSTHASKARPSPTTSGGGGRCATLRQASAAWVRQPLRRPSRRRSRYGRRPAPRASAGSRPARWRSRSARHRRRTRRGSRR